MPLSKNRPSDAKGPRDRIESVSRRVLKETRMQDDSSTTPDFNDVAIETHIIRREDLSLKAKGLLMSLASAEANGLPTTVEAMAECVPDGSHAVRSGMAELLDAGLIQRHQKRNDDGRLSVGRIEVSGWLIVPKAERG